MNNLFDEKILCEYWDTPVLQSNELWLEMQFYTESQIVSPHPPYFGRMMPWTLQKTFS